jgi:hypothetical protein
MTAVRALLLVALISASSAAAESGHLLAGEDLVRLLPPAGAVLEPYRNTGYQMRFVEGAVEVLVDLEPIRSRAPFVAPRIDASDRVARQAVRAAGTASTRYDAVTGVLGWIRGRIRYELDRGAPQEPEAVLDRGSAYCTGIARLAVAMLGAIGVEAREVPGFVLEDLVSGPRAGFHRWIEVHYPDRGWVFSDPLATFHYVPATYVRLADERLEDVPGAGRLLARDRRVVSVDLDPRLGSGLTARRNDDRRTAAALVVRIDGGGAGMATLDGAEGRRELWLSDGSGSFLGLPPGQYVLRVESGGRIAAQRSVVIRGTSLGELTIPIAVRSFGAGGGGGGR